MLAKYWECICGGRTKGRILTDEQKCRCKDQQYEAEWYLMPAQRILIRRNRRIMGLEYGVPKYWTKQAKKDAAKKVTAFKGA